jgi:hypothetical protein
MYSLVMAACLAEEFSANPEEFRDTRYFETVSALNLRLLE